MIRRSFLALPVLAALPKSQARPERDTVDVLWYDFRNDAALVAVTHRPNVRIVVNPPCVKTTYFAVVTVSTDTRHDVFLLSLDGKRAYHVTGPDPYTPKARHEHPDFTLVAGTRAETADIVRSLHPDFSTSNLYSCPFYARTHYPNAG